MGLKDSEVSLYKLKEMYGHKNEASNGVNVGWS